MSGKIHKNDCPIRPIISAPGTYNYNLAKYLNELLTNAVSNDKFILKDTFDFLNKISKIELTEGDSLISFDVISLFTNVPIDETINIIKKRFFNNGRLLDQMNFKTFEKLLRQCVQKSHFIFNKQFYEQCDGVSMGSPLGPVLASIFMNDFELKHMSKLKELGVTTWFRYVDDTFVVINNNKPTEVLNFLNSLHNSIKFTCEHEINNSINFLDVTITRKHLKLVTKTYHKPTFTGVFLNWNSLTSRKYKIGLIHCLLDRVSKICSENEEKNLEKQKLKSVFLSNNYPEHILNSEFDKFEKYQK